jgi:hypothetical protein
MFKGFAARFYIVFGSIVTVATALFVVDRLMSARCISAAAH